MAVAVMGSWNMRADSVHTRLPSIRDLLAASSSDDHAGHNVAYSVPGTVPGTGGSPISHGSQAWHETHRPSFSPYHKHSSVLSDTNADHQNGRFLPPHGHLPTMEPPITTSTQPRMPEPSSLPFTRPRSLSSSPSKTDSGYDSGKASTSHSESHKTSTSTGERDRLQVVRTAICVGQEDVPNLGPCYVYDDGTLCPVKVHGEAVNPSWGITKAGKARKRIPYACSNCRRQKLRCEPSQNGCARCQQNNLKCVAEINFKSPGSK